MVWKVTIEIKRGMERLNKKKFREVNARLGRNLKRRIIEKNCAEKSMKITREESILFLYLHTIIPTLLFRS